MGKIKMTANIIRQEMIGTDIFSMIIEAKEIAVQAKPGQFVDLYSADGSKLLPRPISLCEIDREAGTLRLVYRIAGKGTAEFSKLTSEHTIDVLGPLGNGFNLEDGKAILIGGGIGIPPMLQLAKELKCEKSIVLGYRDEEFLSEEFKAYGEVYKSSDNGAIGVKGTVMDAIKEYGIEGTHIYACGPTPMLRAIQQYALENGIRAQLSLEERMHVLHVYASLRRLTTTQMLITREYVRMVLYFTLRRWSYNEY